MKRDFGSAHWKKGFSILMLIAFLTAFLPTFCPAKIPISDKVLKAQAVCKESIVETHSSIDFSLLRTFFVPQVHIPLIARRHSVWRELELREPVTHPIFVHLTTLAP